MDSDELRALRALIAAQSAQIGALVAAIKPAPNALTVAALYAMYEAANRSRVSWCTTLFRLRPVVKALGARLASSLTVADWTAYRLPREGTLSVRTLNHELSWIKAMARWGVAQGLLETEPPVCAAKKAKCKKHRETAPSEADVGRLLEEARAVERVIVLCACDSGMRRNEIRQLQWSWIDRERMELALPNWACKGGRGRTVPMTTRQLAAIDTMVRDIRSPYVLTNPKTGKPYHRGRFSHWWRELARLAGIEAVPGETRVHLHDGRHGYATNAAKRGVRIEVIQEILGHASLDQTRDYVSTSDADLPAARAVFEAGIQSDIRAAVARMPRIKIDPSTKR